MIHKFCLPALAALLFASGSVLAQTPIERSAGIDGDARVNINNLAGSVTVRAWSRNEVRISGTLGREAEQLRVEGDARRLDIEVVYPRNGRGRLSRADETELVIELPRGVELSVQTVSASIDVDGVDGARAELRSVSGDVVFAGQTPDLRIGTVSGSVRSDGGTLRVAVETVSGEADVASAAADVGVRSVSGRVGVKADRVERLNAATVSGIVEVELAALVDDGRVEVETMSGVVGLRLPADLSARIEASTFSGNIRSDFGDVSRPRHGPGQSLDTKAGGGSAHIKATAFSGTVNIRRK